MKLFSLCFVFAFSMLQFASSQVVYVDIANTTGIEDGTQAHPFNSIKEGINAASPGYQVVIRKGTYVPDDSWSGNPHTLLLKAGVSLAGESRDNTIIDGIVVDQQVSNLSIGVEKLRFEEFHFARATHAGPFADRNIIRECATGYIGLPFGPGIPVNDTTPGPNYGFLIENNDLGSEGSIEFKQGEGVSLLTATGNTCGYIQLKSGGGYTYVIDNNDVQYAIFDKSGANTTTISNNTIINGTIDDRSGGNQYGMEDEIIENNTITAGENSPAFLDEDYKSGIMVKSRSATIRNNTITCTGHVSGIRSSAGAPLHITDNTVTLDEVSQPVSDPDEGTPGILNYSGWGYVTGNKIYGGSHGYFSKAGTVEFANNEIENAWTGFYSMGGEVVHHNTISGCKGDGMILAGVKGPLHHNKVINNAGAGIRVTRVPVDLGGGSDNSPGVNTLCGNGFFDLYVQTSNIQHPTLFARHNLWDHAGETDIRQFDIRDGNDSTGLVTVDFMPTGGLGIADDPDSFDLAAFPNPCNKAAIIRWIQPTAGLAEIRVFNSFGKKVCVLASEGMSSGEHHVNFDARDFPAGIYCCQIHVNGVTETKKLVVR
jgi:hypothetical protein